MAVDPWPASLPQKLQASDYRESLGNGLIRSQTDTGPAKVRKRSSAIPRPLAGSVVVTPGQLQIARNFVEVTLMGGALPFSLPDPMTGAPMLVRFVEMPSWSALGGKWFRLSLPLEVLP